MSKYLLVYKSGTMPKKDAEKANFMQAWNHWVREMGNELINPGCGVGMSKTVMSDGTVVDDGGSSPTFGYCLISVDSLEDALKKTQRHPFLKTGGQIEVAPVHE